VGLAEIVQRIAADAELESDRIVSEARERAADIAARAKAGSSETREKTLSEAKAKAARDSAHVLASARLAARNEVLEEKRIALDDAETLARELLAKMGEGAYRGVLAAAAAEHGLGDETVAFDPLDAERLGVDLVKLANDRLVKAGRPGKLALAGATADLGGAGLLLLGDGSEQRITPATLVAEARIELEPEIARSLFADGGEG
jgi:vacuolar-type H+-ATPase subunit E/Vma4